MIGTFKLPTGVGQCGLWQPHWGVDIRPLATSGKVAILVRDDKLTAFKTIAGNYTVSVNGGTPISVTAGGTYTFDPATYVGQQKNVPWHTYGTHTLVVTIDSAGSNELRIAVPSGIPTSSYKYISGLLWVVAKDRWVHFDSSTTTTVMRSPHLECIEIDYPNYNGQILGAQNNGLVKVSINTMVIGVMVAACTALKEFSFSYKDINIAGFSFQNCYLLEYIGISGTNIYVTSLQNYFANCYSLKESITFDLPALYNFAGNTEMNSLTGLTFTRSNFRSSSAPAVCFDISGASALTEANLTACALSIGSYELSQGVIEGKTPATILAGKTFRFSRCLGSATFDATPLTNLGATVTR